MSILDDLENMTLSATNLNVPYPEQLQQQDDRPDSYIERGGVDPIEEMLDRIEMGWLAAGEVAFVLAATSSCTATFLLLRVAGWSPVIFGLFLGGMGAIAVLAAIYWAIASPNAKAKFCFAIAVLIFALTVSTGDAVMDWATHNRRSIEIFAGVAIGAVILFGFSVAGCRIALARGGSDDD